MTSRERASRSPPTVTQPRSESGTIFGRLSSCHVSSAPSPSLKSGTNRKPSISTSSTETLRVCVQTFRSTCSCEWDCIYETMSTVRILMIFSFLTLGANVFTPSLLLWETFSLDLYWLDQGVTEITECGYLHHFLFPVLLPGHMYWREWQLEYG